MWHAVEKVVAQKVMDFSFFGGGIVCMQRILRLVALVRGDEGECKSFLASTPSTT